MGKRSRSRIREAGPTLFTVGGQGSRHGERALVDLVEEVASATGSRDRRTNHITRTVADAAVLWKADSGALTAVGARVEATVADCWRRGWQPAELVRAVSRGRTGPEARLLAWAVSADASRYRTHPHANPAWMTQVERAEGRRPAPPDWLRQWWEREQLPAARAVWALAHLLHVLRAVTPPPKVGPCPDEWGRETASPAGTGDDVDAKILGRVRALLAKAESTPYPEEADALIDKAQELMTRHAIDRVLVSAGEPARAERPAARRVVIEDPYAQAKVSLLLAVARSCRCRGVWMKDIGSCTVFGYPSDLALLDVLYTSLLAQAASAMARVATDAAAGGDAAAGARERHARSRAFRHAFLVSYAGRIGARLLEANRRTIDAAAVTSAALLPVLASREDQVERALRDAFPSTERFSLRASDTAGWAAGHAAADRADLGTRQRVAGIGGELERGG